MVGFYRVVLLILLLLNFSVFADSLGRQGRGVTRVGPVEVKLMGPSDRPRGRFFVAFLMVLDAIFAVRN